MCWEGSRREAAISLFRICLRGEQYPSNACPLPASGQPVRIWDGGYKSTLGQVHSSAFAGKVVGQSAGFYSGIQIMSC
jgi:hypothetical protein